MESRKVKDKNKVSKLKPKMLFSKQWNDCTSSAIESRKVETAEDTVAAECSSKVAEDGEAVDVASRESEADDEWSVSPKPRSAADDEVTNKLRTSPTLEYAREYEREVARKNFQLGIRLLESENYDAAVPILKSTCLRYMKIYGERSKECGIVYMAYGDALFQLLKRDSKREMSDSVGGVRKSLEKNNNVEMETKISDERAVEAGANFVEDAPPGTATVEAEEEKTAEERVESEHSADEESAQLSDVWSTEGTISDDSADVENDDEEGNVVLAMLALKTFNKSRGILFDVEDFVNLARVHSRMAEIGMELKDYEGAINNFLFCLEILRRSSSATVGSRQVANVHYQLSSAYLADGRYDMAADELMEAMTTAAEYLRTLHERASSSSVMKGNEAEQFCKEVLETENFIKMMTDTAARMPAECKATEDTSVEPMRKMAEFDISTDYLIRTLVKLSFLDDESTSSSATRPSPSVVKVLDDHQPRSDATSVDGIISRLMHKLSDSTNWFQKRNCGTARHGTTVEESAESVYEKEGEGRIYKRKADQNAEQLDETESGSKRPYRVTVSNSAKVAAASIEAVQNRSRGKSKRKAGNGGSDEMESSAKKPYIDELRSEYRTEK